MLTIEFLEEQLRARPFVPLTVVTNSGDRFRIKTRDHAGLPRSTKRQANGTHGLLPIRNEAFRTIRPSSTSPASPVWP